MELKEIIRKSKHTKQIASKILETTNLISILSKFGKTEIIGSYKYDLMCGPDLDIVVETDYPRISSFNALTNLIKTESFAKYEYGDFVKFPRTGRPKGYIIVLKIEIEKVKWEIEVWFLDKKARPQDEIDILMRNITEAQRNGILTLKYDREAKGIDKNSFSSVEIYKKVLQK